MTRVLVIGNNKTNLADFVRDWIPGAKILRGGHRQVQSGDHTFDLVTVGDWDAIKGYSWNRIEVLPGAREHPHFDEFYAYVGLSLVQHTTDDDKQPLHWNRPPTEREKAAIEVAEAYRAWRNREGLEPGQSQSMPPADYTGTHRLIAAADAWEKVR